MLDRITDPRALRDLDPTRLKDLCEEIRAFLIGKISVTGGHIGANLGTIELTVAMHHVFDSPADAFVFDTGHQGYTHKLLTGRMAAFDTLNTWGGMSRFIEPKESVHDVLGASHAGTAISTAAGLAMARRADGSGRCVVAVVGDGALVEGASFEGLNYAVESSLPLVIVVNDNGMAIAPNVGGIRNLFAGDDWAIKARGFFGGLGYRYLPVADGHDLPSLIAAMHEARDGLADGPAIVHAKTIKGRGLACADGHKYRMHFSMPFDPVTGSGASPTIAGRTYAVVASRALQSMMAADPTIIALSPATPYASELDPVAAAFPDRVIDVGMAEQHAVSMAAGLAMRGFKPVVCFQSTFMQRAMDQIIHDLAYPDLPVTILAVRSGFAGYDSGTHHGIYDLSWLQAIPGLQVFHAGTAFDVDAVVRWRLAAPKSPMVILYPYEQVREGELEPVGACRDITRPDQIGEPAPICLISTGNRLETCLAIRDRLVAAGRAVCVVNPRWIKPLPVEALLPCLKAASLVVTFEENSITGGLGSAVAALMTDHGLTARLLRSASPDAFMPPGSKAEVSVVAGIDVESVWRRVQAYLG
jgi:1-deoxy-D-xylulose-5-phosphate synthase